MHGAIVAVVLAQLWHRDCPPPPGEQGIFLGVGTQKVLNFKGLKATLMRREVPFELKDLGHDQLLIIGDHAGHATLTVFDGEGRHDFEVRVRVGSLDTIITNVGQYSPCGVTTTARMVGARYFIEGEASSLEEWAGIRKLVAAQPNVTVLAHLAPKLVEQEIWGANHALWRAGFPDAHFERVGNEILVEGQYPEGEHFAAAAQPLLEELKKLMPYPVEPLPRPDGQRQ